MALIETESLVLKSYNLAEADKIVVLLTRDHGVVRGVAKGVKRLKSRFGSGLEPFSQVNVTYFEKDSSDLVSIQKAEIVQSNFAAASDPDFLQKFSFLGDLLIAFMPPHDPNEKLFRMAKACVEAAVADATNLAAIGLYFEVWLLRLSGYLPDWSRCDQCKRVFADDEQTNIQSDFHLKCQACSRSGRQILDGPNRALVAAVLSIAPAKFAEQTTNKGRQLNDLSTIIRPLTARSLGREVIAEKSLSIGL